MEQNSVGEQDEYTKQLLLALRSSSTSQRRAALQGLKQKIAGKLQHLHSGQRGRLTRYIGLPQERSRTILYLLCSTYPAYHDRPSRQSVQGCLEVLLSTFNTTLADFTTFLSTEAAKPGISPSNAFVLIEWCSLALQICAADKERWAVHGLNIVTADAILIELYASLDVRSSVYKSALVVTRRALRKLFKVPKLGEGAIRSIVSQLTQKSQSGSKNAVFLGVAAGVCSRLASVKPILEGLKPQYYSFWVREIIGSKSLVPRHIATAFYDFFSSFTTIQDLESDIIPALEKALLRAPEVVLNDLVTPMIKALPPHLDLSEILSIRLLKPLLSNVKSTNSDIRNGACSAFNVLAERCHKDQPLEQVAKEILLPLTASKIASAEQRIIHARMLSALPSKVTYSAAVSDGLASVVSKEPNEAAAAAEGNALVHHLSSILEYGLPDAGRCVSVFLKGLEDKRPAFRRLWALRSGDILWHISRSSSSNPASESFVEALVPKMLDLFNEVATNPLPATQSGLVVAGHIIVSLHTFLATSGVNIRSALKKANVMQQALVIGAKPSFLLNYRVYTKLSNSEDLTWLLRSIDGCSGEVCSRERNSDVGEAWLQALLYTILASDIPYSIQHDASELLISLYRKSPTEVAQFVISGLWTWYRNLETGVKESAATVAHIGLDKGYLVLKCICPRIGGSLHNNGNVPSSDILQSQLIDMLVLSRPEILPRSNWIEMCLRVGQDPGSLVTAQTSRCMGKVEAVLEGNETGLPSTATKLAAYKTYAELAFVAPEIITPLLVEQIESHLPVKELRQYGPTEFAIARTPEGTTFVDVLSGKVQNRGPDKGARDYDTLKWEEEVRSQLALKKGQQKKLSADEQAKVNAQLKKEAGIRAQVLGLKRQLERGIGIIHGLATGPPTEADIWMGPSIRALLEVIEAGVGLLLGNSADEVYISCSNFVSLRLGSLRKFIGIATLRAIGSTQLSEELVQEPLGGANLYLSTS
jgi:hypothetical protein